MAGESERKLPEANEFSPGQVILRRVLELVRDHEGNRANIVEAIRQEYFLKSALGKPPTERLKQQRTRANNVLIGLKGYRLFSLDSNRLTTTARKLLKIGDEKLLHEAFATHVLLNCHGLEVLEAVRSIQARRERVTKQSLKDELHSRGFTLPRATTHHTKLLQWLREAGVLDSDNVIDEEAVTRLSGVDLGSIRDWSLLTREQKALLRTLRQQAEISGEELVTAKSVVDKSEYQHGRIFREDQLRAKVFRPLQEQGWMRLSEMRPGRGGKSGKLAATKKLIDLDLGLMGPDVDWGIPADLRARLDTPLDEIHRDLGANDKLVRGVALELLAVRMAHDLGLVPLRFRLRGTETGGAEVDLIAEGAHLHFSRWLFQCKNVSSRVPLSALAKEVGMAVLLKAHVIVLATTGKFSETVKEYAHELSEGSYLQAVLVDQTVLESHKDKGAGTLLDFFHREASHTMMEKRPQIDRAESIES